MRTASELLEPQTVADLSGLLMTARRIVDGLSVGKHASPQKGFSTQFKEHRAYVPGDQLRSLDWKLYGKTDRLYVKQYEEEINLHATILLDASGSMRFAGQASGGLSKLHYASVLAAAAAFVLLRQQDAIGLQVLGGRPVDDLPPRSRGSYLQDILRRLVMQLNTPATRDASDQPLHKKIESAASRIRSRSMLIIISDMLDAPELLDSTLRTLAAARHDIWILQTWDRDELDFPYRGDILFRDLENAERSVQVDASGAADLYRRRRGEFQSRLEEVCRRRSARLILSPTDLPPAEPLRNILATRGGRS